jgi:hypothetical protein
MHPEPLLGIHAKIERAETHINDLMAVFNAWVASNPYELVSEVHPDGSEEVWRFRNIKRFPSNISPIAGDAFSNLRTVLDNLVGALAIRNGKTPQGASFPFGVSVEEFEKSLADKAKKLPSLARDMIAVLKPYKGGNDLLWLLHRVNLSDKHWFPMRVELAEGMKMSGIVVRDAEPLIIGDRNGKHYIAGGYIPRRKWSGQKNDLEVLTTRPGAKIETDMQLSFRMVFGDVEGFKGEPVVAVLHHARDAVKRIVSEFETTFFA